MRPFETVDIAVISIAVIALVNMLWRFDSVIVNGCIAAITGCLTVNRYLASRDKTTPAGEDLPRVP